MVQLAGCLLFDTSGGLLLLYRPEPRNRWETPGGKVEAGETPADAVVRELSEELGVTVAVGRSLGTTHFREHGVSYTYHWFIASIERGTPQLQEPEKHSDLRYIPWEELSSEPISFNLVALLDQYPTLEAIHEG